jgi:hypothetical protein
MLLSLVVLAIGGGVLAIKTKECNFCIYKLNPQGTLCPLFQTVESVKLTNAPNIPPRYYTMICNNCPATVNPVLCSLRTTDVLID